MNIFCIGRNYAAHARELGNEVPEEPVIFMKPGSALWNPSTPFYYPSFTRELHYECELVLRISKAGRNIPEQEAAEYYDAVTAGIDFTARDIQTRLKTKGLPWEKAKAWDNAAVTGEWQPASETGNANDIRFSLSKNGQVVQQGHTANMIHSFAAVISHISGYFSLHPGDLVFTGTPEGVGGVQAGDVLEGFLAEKSMFRLEIQQKPA